MLSVGLAHVTYGRSPMSFFEVWCVEWYDQNDERHIRWGVPQPEILRDELIEQGMDPNKIDIYLKDVS